MQAGYFKTAWNDIKESPGWIGKMFLLALILLIPIFGPIVVYGYLYGWARDIAWNVKGPLPKHIFGNEDGKLYSRGFFILVLGIVLSLVPGIVIGILSGIVTLGTMGIASGGSGMAIGALLIMGLFSLVLFVASFVLAFAVMFFQWVGSMRVSIYGRLSAGFQLKKIWAMIRHDANGILRIFGMVLITSLVLSIIISIIFSLAMLIIFLIALAMGGTSMTYGYYDSSVWGAIVGIGFFGFLIILVATYLSMVGAMWIEALMVRALGYWTRQFDVPSWRGQEDPMPFELHQATHKTSTPVSPTAPQAGPGAHQQPFAHNQQTPPVQHYNQEAVQVPQYPVAQAPQQYPAAQAPQQYPAAQAPQQHQAPQAPMPPEPPAPTGNELPNENKF